MRWQRMQSRDAYYDTQEVYSPISALDIVLDMPLHTFDLKIKRGTLDLALTAHAEHLAALS